MEIKYIKNIQKRLISNPDKSARDSNGILINSELKIIASGGIANIDHLHKLADIGVEGAIIGSALYTDRVDLSEAVNSLQRTN